MVNIVKAVAPKTAPRGGNAIIVYKILNVIIPNSRPEGKGFKVLNDTSFIFPGRFRV